MKTVLKLVDDRSHSRDVFDRFRRCSTGVKSLEAVLCAVEPVRASHVRSGEQDLESLQREARRQKAA